MYLFLVMIVLIFCGVQLNCGDDNANFYQTIATREYSSRSGKKLQQAVSKGAQLYNSSSQDANLKASRKKITQDLLALVAVRNYLNEPETLPEKSSQLARRLYQAKELDGFGPQEINYEYLEERAEMQRATLCFTDRNMWTAACRLLPKNISVMSGVPLASAFLQHPNIQYKAGAWREFELALNKTFDILGNGELAFRHNWTNKGIPSKDFFRVTKHHGAKIVDVFEPYVQKLVLNPGDKVVFHGDLHGDIHSLINMMTWLENRGYLQPGTFRLASNNIYLVFLGDYVDRGYYGAEVIYSLLRLKIANPDQVVLVRGNHEDEHMNNSKDGVSFKSELDFKFRSDKDVHKLISRLYNFMPVALYVGHGNDYIQCSHGGIEHGYMPANLLNSSAKFDLVGTLFRFDCLAADNYKIGHMMSSMVGNELLYFDQELQANFAPEGLKYIWNNHLKGPAEWRTLGFAWFDFAKTGRSFWIPGRGLVADRDLTKAVLDYQNKSSEKKVRGIFRAHQHTQSIDQSNPTNLMTELMSSDGVYKMWQPIEIERSRSLVDGIVWTFNVSPDSSYGLSHNYKKDAFAILGIQQDYKNWRLSVYNISSDSKTPQTTSSNSPQLTL